MIPPQLQSPLLIAIIGGVIALGLWYQKTLSYTEYATVMRFKPRVFAILQVIQPLGYSRFIHEKEHPSNEDEYLKTTDLTPKEVFKRLTSAGGDPHILSSTKRRPDGSLSKWHYVWLHDDGTQTECYIFPNGDVHIHNETIATDVDGHLSDGITPGDPKGVLDGVEL